MDSPLFSARRKAGLTQQELGEAVARRLGRQTTSAAAKKRIARWEAHESSPSAEEMQALAAELDLDIAQLAAMFMRAPVEARLVVEGLANSSERCLIAACCFSRTRPKILEESLESTRNAIETGKVCLASFVPYPQTVALPQSSNHVSHLVGYYAAVRKSLLDFTRTFQDSLSPERRDAVALYFPRSDLERNARLLIPPVFRQFFLILHATGTRVIRRELLLFTPAVETDISRPLRATGVYSLDDQLDAWQSFFGDIIEVWLSNGGELPAHDSYWQKAAPALPQQQLT
jgi:transcriptional regulator with XRE-family HTH domain